MARKIISSDISIGGEFQNGSTSKLVIDNVKSNKVSLTRRNKVTSAIQESYDLPASDAVFCLSLSNWLVPTSVGENITYPVDPVYVPLPIPTPGTQPIEDINVNQAFGPAQL
jgi:hypothetical protein